MRASSKPDIVLSKLAIQTLWTFLGWDGGNLGVARGFLVSNMIVGYGTRGVLWQ